MRAALALLLPAALLLAGLGAPSRAAAQREEAAEVLLREGYERRQGGDLEGALALFEQAYELHAAPRIVAQLGLTEAAMERWLSAERHLALALAEAEDEFIQRRRAALEAALREIRGHLGDLALRGGEAGAEVRLDGQPRGRLPFPDPLRVEVGRHRLEVLGEGAPFVREVDVAAGATAEVELPGGAAESSSGTEPGNEAPSETPEEGESSSEEGPGPIDHPQEERPVLRPPDPEPWAPGWILAGAGGAAIVAGAILGILVLDAEAQLLSRCAGDGDGDDRLCAPGVMEEASFVALQDQERAMAPAADALLFGGLGLAALGVALALALATPPEEERTSARPAPTLGLSADSQGGTLWLHGAF